MKTDLSKIYSDWLFNTVYDKYGTNVKTHRKLLNQLHRTVFEAVNQNDQTRIDDGIELRFRFCWEKFSEFDNYFNNNYIFINTFPETKCSILEMMIALSFRADENFALNVPLIFWEMVRNMGLIGETDDLYDEEHVSNVLKRFVMREYDRNGHGGLFMFPIGYDEDIRTVEIWYQLCWYVNEKQINS